MDFRGMWLLSALALLILAGIAGRSVIYGTGVWKAFRILVDERDRFSLNRLQLVMWTILILSTFLALFWCDGLDLKRAAVIPAELLGLLGISLGSGVIAGAMKDGKDKMRPEKIAGGPGYAHQPAIERGIRSEPAHFTQVFLEEEGQAANKIISVTKFQNFIFTMALGIIYVVLTLKAGGYPTFAEQIIWLIGVSHAGYLGGKVPDKP